MFNTINYDELQIINGGFKGEDVFGGALIFVTGVGLLAAACVPGVNVVAAAGLAYAGSWGLAGGVFMTTYGFVA